MHNTDTQALAEALYQLLPADGSNLGNATLLRTLQAAAEAQGQTITEEAFQAARQHLVDAGRAVKGKGRGGSTGRNVESSRVESSRVESSRVESRKI